MIKKPSSPFLDKIAKNPIMHVACTSFEIIAISCYFLCNKKGTIAHDRFMIQFFLRHCMCGVNISVDRVAIFIPNIIHNLVFYLTDDIIRSLCIGKNVLFDSRRIAMQGISGLYRLKNVHLFRHLLLLFFFIHVFVKANENDINLFCNDYYNTHIVMTNRVIMT